MTNSIVTNYVDAALAKLRRRNSMHCVGKPPEQMWNETIVPSSDGWYEWKPIPSTVTDADMDNLERETGLAYPPHYRDFLHYQHFIDLTEVGIRFERHLCDKWADDLRELYFRSYRRERILDVGLLPFGSESLMDAGLVCFDTRYRDASGDCPIVYWDHQWIGNEKEIGVMFSSSAKMFECLTMVAENDINFIYHDDDDEPSLLPQKRLLLTKFLETDPDGAGGAGREYWTSWGVTPVA